MKWQFFLVLIVIAFVIPIALIYRGIVTLDVGAILGLLSFFVPAILDYVLKPKVSLKIMNPRFKKEKIDQQHFGYQLETTVINRGRKICYNLKPSFDIKEINRNMPKLLHVHVQRENGHETKTIQEGSLRKIRHAWIDEDGNVISKDILKEMRQDDNFVLLFPYETSYMPIGSIGGGVSSSGYYFLLKLNPGLTYKVKITIKGEDADKNTIIARKEELIKPT